MYDVMIIDDDLSIQERLKSIIDWEKCGVRLVCQAQDSDTARELFLLHRPKIIITDIQIPIISGLELAQEISIIDPQIRFIVITGFADFEYAKTSIRLGAVDLLSKPILPERINDSLKKAVAYFEKLKLEHISSQNMKLLLKENIPVFREKFVSFLLSRESSYTHNEIMEKFFSLQIDVLGDLYACVQIRPNIKGLSTGETDLALVATKSTCDEQLLSSGYKVYSLYDSNYCLNCLISWNTGNSESGLEEVMQNISEQMSFYWNIKAVCGIGPSTSDITKLHSSNQKAYIALNSQYATDGGPVIYKNIERLDNPIIADRDNVISQIILCFKKNDLEKMSQLIREEIASIFGLGENDIRLARKLIFEITSSVLAESISQGIDIETISKYSEIYSNIFSSENIKSLVEHVLDFIKNVSLELAAIHSDSKNKLIEMAKKYIADNVHNSELSLDMVSSEIGLSSIYFCKLFHKEEGVSFNTYLNEKRVESAKKLLKNTNLKVYEVADATGYNNSKYFNYVFKRIADITPLEYRNCKSGSGAKNI